MTIKTVSVMYCNGALCDAEFSTMKTDPRLVLIEAEGVGWVTIHDWDKTGHLCPHCADIRKAVRK